MNKLTQFVRQRIWAPLPKVVTAQQCRSAAWLWGGALLVLAAFGAWGHMRRGEPIGLRTIGWVVLAVVLSSALLTPAGPRVYLYVLRFFAFFGFIISHVVLTLGYFVMVTPLALLMRARGRDPLDMNPAHAPAWKDHAGKTDRRRYFRLS